jgi:hypothetical protein
MGASAPQRPRIPHLFLHLLARVIRHQLERGEWRILLVLDQALEHLLLLHEIQQFLRLGAARRASGQGPHHGPAMIGLLVFQEHLGRQRSGQVRRQVARILRADGQPDAERPALARQVFQMLR